MEPKKRPITVGGRYSEVVFSSDGDKSHKAKISQNLDSGHLKSHIYLVTDELNARDINVQGVKNKYKFHHQ